MRLADQPEPTPLPTSVPFTPLPVINGKHQQEAMASTHVLLPHGPELLLASGVQDCGDRDGCHGDGLPLATHPQALRPPHPLLPALTVQPGGDAIHDTELRVGVLDGGIVVRHKVRLVGWGEAKVSGMSA